MFLFIVVFCFLCGFWAKPSRLRTSSSKMMPKDDSIASKILLGAEKRQFMHLETTKLRAATDIPGPETHTHRWAVHTHTRYEKIMCFLLVFVVFWLLSLVFVAFWLLFAYCYSFFLYLIAPTSTDVRLWAGRRRFFSPDGHSRSAWLEADGRIDPTAYTHKKQQK